MKGKISWNKIQRGETSGADNVALFSSYTGFVGRKVTIRVTDEAILWARRQAAEREIQRLRTSVAGATRLHDLHGTAPAMQELFALARKIGPCVVN